MLLSYRLAAWNFAAPLTHWLYGERLDRPAPLTGFLLTPLHAFAGVEALPLSSLRSALTHWLNGVPFCPLMRFLLAPRQ